MRTHLRTHTPTCLGLSGVRCSNRRSLESLCAAEEQLKEALREKRSRRRQHEEEDIFTRSDCLSVRLSV